MSSVIDLIQNIKKIIQNNHNQIDSLFDAIAEIKDDLVQELNSIKSGTYTILFQHLGFLIRRGSINNRNILICKNESATGHFLIPSVIYKLINIYRIIDEIRNEKQEDEDKKCATRIVIESLRNHQEVHYLRARFPNFFMLAVHRDENDRVQSIVRKYGVAASFVREYEKGKLNVEDGSKAKFWYMPNEKTEAEEFWLSDISKCIQLCDIHAFNRRQSDTYNDLRAQLCWYLALVLHPGLFTPTDYERAMNLAFQAKLSSGCISRQVGAVVTDSEFRVLSVGCNDVPKSQTPCILRSVEGCITCSSSSSDYSVYEKKPIYEDSFKQHLATKFYQQKNEKEIIEYNTDEKRSPNVRWDESVPLSYCFKDVQNHYKGGNNQVHTRAVHAEENAMLQIGYMALPKDSVLFTTSSTCELCAKKATELGIAKIYYIEPYTGLASIHNLQYTTSPELKQFFGAVGLGFYRLYMPLLPMKEELVLLGARPTPKDA